MKSIVLVAYGMFFYIVFTPILKTSGQWSTGNTRKYQQIDVYIYQCEYWSQLKVIQYYAGSFSKALSYVSGKEEEGTVLGDIEAQF